MPTVAPPMSIDKIIATWRKKHPEALVCVSCGRLVCTERHRYKSLTDEQAAAYTCAECRSDVTESARAFERLRGRPKPLTEAQLREADAYCAWCRRWFNTKDGGGGVSCDPCRRSLGNGWALPHEIPPQTGARDRQLEPWILSLLNHDQTASCGAEDPVQPLRAGSARQIRQPGERSRLLGRSGRVPARRKVSEASLAALRKINRDKTAKAGKEAGVSA